MMYACIAAVLKVLGNLIGYRPDTNYDQGTHLADLMIGFLVTFVGITCVATGVWWVVAS